MTITAAAIAAALPDAGTIEPAPTAADAIKAIEDALELCHVTPIGPSWQSLATIYGNVVEVVAKNLPALKVAVAGAQS